MTKRREHGMKAHSAPLLLSFWDTRCPNPLRQWVRASPPCICLDRYIPIRVYTERGIRIRNYCRAQPPRDLGPPGLVPAVGGRDRAPASYAAADRIKAPARAARGWFCRIQSGCTAPSLPAEAGTLSGVRCLAGPVPPVLVRSYRCPRTPPRPHASANTGEKENIEGEADAAHT